VRQSWKGAASASARAVSARLDVTSNCRVIVQVSANEDPEVIDNCTGSFSGGNIVSRPAGVTAA
jgi:hypothetical protein